jgi:hypothetical protein
MEERKVYLWAVDGRVIAHTDLEAAAQLDGLTREPDLQVLATEFAAAGNHARVIDGAIVVGKTERERKADAARKRIGAIDAALAALDAKHLTPRTLSGIATGDAYALEQKNLHDAAASPLRRERNEQNQLLQAALE